MNPICTPGARIGQFKCTPKARFFASAVAGSLSVVRTPFQRAIRVFLGRWLVKGMTKAEMAKRLGASRTKLINYLQTNKSGFIELRHLENFAARSGVSMLGVLHEIQDIMEHHLHPTFQAHEETFVGDTKAGRRKTKVSAGASPGSPERASAADEERARKKRVPRVPLSTP